MFDKAFDEVSRADLEALVEARIPEGRRLEFKRDHYGRNDEAKKEFAADVSALANAQGGYLLIGVAEENGIAADIPGVEAADGDGLVLAVTESIRSSIEPPIPGVRVRWVEIAAGRGVLIVQVDRSWSAPHRVTVARDNRFFLRDENGKHPMSVTELKRAFLFASEVEERIRRFRMDRLTLLIANEGPLALHDNLPRLILHLVPQAAFTDGIQLSFDPRQAGIRPLGSSGWNSMHSLDGQVNYSGPYGQLESVRAFSTLFRNGVVESASQIHAGQQDGQRAISLTGLEHDVIPALRNSLETLAHYAVPGPYYLMLSLLGVRGLCAPMNDWRSGLAYPHRADRVLLPEMLVDEATTKTPPASWLRPMFDLLWNAFGQAGSPNYDTEGRYLQR